eukprot:CAMPEP_0117683332 /NCGR_PEP_ID=MMETSP0804-20121206/20320_1 /TAXON_ID=1074897 /ORGANISM="Tetraselmis astigmatica, Strain CCMP880" /LENGTH=82 /DNA_ID=CAMNT_0005493871 /DNA_START=48 /DNA_END=292 /DNA_ORIENTATION=-
MKPDMELLRLYTASTPLCLSRTCTLISCRQASDAGMNLEVVLLCSRGQGSVAQSDVCAGSSNAACDPGSTLREPCASLDDSA